MHLPHSKKYGITGPLSVKESSEDDIARSSSLQEFLLASKIYETNEEAITRERVLGRLSYMFDNFIKAIGVKKGLADSDVKAASGRIYTFGSYRLGVHARGSDIDTLCVAPVYVDRKEFFDEFYSMLNGVFAEVEKVEDAYVPLMQLVYREHRIDECEGCGVMSGNGNKMDISNTAVDKIGALHSCDELQSYKRLRTNNERVADAHPGSSEKKEDGGDEVSSQTHSSEHTLGLRVVSANNGVLKDVFGEHQAKTSERSEHNEKSDKEDESAHNKESKTRRKLNSIADEHLDTQQENRATITHDTSTGLNKEMIEIKIDLVFARLNVFKIDSSLNLLDSSLLKNLDEKSVLSLNGNRVTDEILSLVPNKKVFHGALRCIKYWAKRRGLTGHLYGYFGGVAYAISVARICQLFPNMCEYTIICKYFELYKEWKWPTPVMLKKIENLNYNLKVWDPKIHPSDKFHKMPVITPSYPSMCSTHNIINSTMKRYKEELERGHRLLAEGKEWKEFFRSTDFFQRYKSFLAVFILLKRKRAGYDICGANTKGGASKRFVNEREQKSSMQTINTNVAGVKDNDSVKEASLHKMWQGHVNSRIRFLSTKLETVEQLDSAPPFPQTFDICDFSICHPLDFIPKNSLCSVTFIALDMADSKQLLRKKIFIDAPIEEFKEMVFDWDRRTKDMDLVMRAMKRKDVNVLLKDLHDFEQKNKCGK